MNRIFRAAAMAVAACSVSGCGGPADHARVAGKVVKGGAAYHPADDRSLRLTLHPADPARAGHVYAASLDREGGTFGVDGPEGYGVPKGKYRVEVVENPRAGTLTGKEKAGRKRIDDDHDYLAGRFAGPTSPFAIDVDGTSEVTIDLDTPSKAPAPARAAARPGRGDRD